MTLGIDKGHWLGQAMQRVCPAILGRAALTAVLMPDEPRFLETMLQACRSYSSSGMKMAHSLHTTSQLGKHTSCRRTNVPRVWGWHGRTSSSDEQGSGLHSHAVRTSHRLELRYATAAMVESIAKRVGKLCRKVRSPYTIPYGECVIRGPTRIDSE